jgi:hypothetical protein
LRIGDFEERERIEKSILTIENFAVSVSRIPHKNNFGSLKEMKAYLWNHFEEIVEKES